MIITYPAIFTKESEGNYKGVFPDFPGSYVLGDSIDDAVSNAIEMAREYIRVTLQDGEDLPLVTDPELLTLKEGEELRMISATIRMYDGWDE